MDIDSVVYCALEKANSLFDLGPYNKILLYSYRNDKHFSELWDLFDFYTPTNNQTTIVIVWDGIPQRNIDTVNTSKYLTPVDWAVGFSIAINNRIKSKQLSKYPDLRIVILDLDSTKSWETESIRFFKQAPMPWIRLMQPLKSSDGISGFFSKMFLNDSVQNSLPTFHGALENGHVDFEITKNIWAARLTKPSTLGDHHALANIIGPIILMGNDGSDPHVTALHYLLKSIGLMPPMDEKSFLRREKPWVDINKSPMKNILEDLGSQINIVLVDDQHASGWGKMLCCAFGAEFNNKDKGEIGKSGGVRIKAFSSADNILDKIDGTDKRFHLMMDEDKTSSRPEILFLDLRLFSGRDIADEAVFFGKLLPLAKKFKEDDELTNLPWPGFKEEEIEKVTHWISNANRKREVEEYIIALSFLPRILALTDLSLPIILFSSTGRRDITDKFEDYGTIITDFAKPKFTVDMQTDIAQQTKAMFEEAFGKSLQVLRIRQKCKKIIDYSSLRKDTTCNTSKDKFIHTELYIDETLADTTEKLEQLPESISFPLLLNNRMYYNPYRKELTFRGEMSYDTRNVLLDLSNDYLYTEAIKNIFKRSKKEDEVHVGGVFAVFTGSTVSDAQQKADSLDNDLVEKGIRYFDSLGVGALSPGIKDKKDSSISELESIYRSSANKPENLVFVKLGCRLPLSEMDDDFFEPLSGDNLFRMTLVGLIELFLAEIIPNLFPEKHEEISISIYAGTRIKPYKKQDKGQFIKMVFKLGLESAIYTSTENKTSYILKSINRDSLFPIVFDTLSYHNLKRTIHRITGAKLPYKSLDTIPEYFLCNKCGEIKRIDIHRDIVEKCNDTGLQIGKISSIFINQGSGKLTAQFEIINPSVDGPEKATVFEGDWKEMKSAEKGQYVSYERLQERINPRSIDKWYVAKGVRLLTEEETTRICNDKKAILREDVLTCNCGDLSSYTPDYRALHYIADEILNHKDDVYESKGYGEVIKFNPCGFEDMLQDVEKTIIASRYFDMGDVVGAIAEVSLKAVDEFSVTPLLLKRITSVLGKLKGEEFCRIGSRIEQGGSDIHFQFSRISSIRHLNKEKENRLAPEIIKQSDTGNKIKAFVANFGAVKGNFTSIDVAVGAPNMITITTKRPGLIFGQNGEHIKELHGAISNMFGESKIDIKYAKPNTGKY